MAKPSIRAVMSPPAAPDDADATTQTLAIIGLGYVGLPSAVFFAEAGFKVIGADVKEDAVREIGRGRSHLPDLGMDARIADLVGKGMLGATTDVAAAVRQADAVFVMVPTPLGKNYAPDLRFIKNAGRMVAKGLQKGQLVVLESTVYPGVTEEVMLPELERSGLKAGTDFSLAYCPERYNPGDSEHTISQTRRIVGGIDADSTQRAAQLYGTITKAGVVPVADIRTCEAAKIIENTQRDLNIALMNEFALILERLGLDVEEVLQAAATKWNFVPFRPGPGVGGHCLPKDPYYLTTTAEKAGYRARTITAGRKVNDSMPRHVFGLLRRGLRAQGRKVRGARVAVLGLSYKPDIGDTRLSPSLEVCRLLEKAGATITTVDPFVPAAEAQESFSSSLHLFDLDGLQGDVDAFVLMVGHKAYLPLPLARFGQGGREPLFVDGPRLVPPMEAGRNGLRYVGVGAGRHNPAW